MRLAFLVLAALPVFAQNSGSLSAPALGLVFDAKASALRPILGVPGASYVGAALPHGGDLKLAEVAPGGRFALAVATDGALLLVTLDRRQPLALALETPDRLRFNPAGDHAVVARAGSLEVISGLPNEPRVKWSAALAQDGLLALDDTGDRVLAAAGAKLLAVRMGGQDVVLDGEEYRSLEFGAKSGRALAVTARGILAIENNAAQLLAEQSEMAAAVPVGDRILLARRNGELAWLGADTAVATCPCAPTRLDRQLDGRLLRLNTLDDAPLWMAEPGLAETKLFFSAFSGGER